ncbi:Spy/CpxP family protein refolding chaperone [uncultured Kordia sp.]|uniref:Spy/CpxP family protein refolding chaperone n=1 Tax=uncultured Kordia sp. TaxID=507699 RepID=UPI0026117C44|nr:Spy/CpxP family protein refolding chaperone [uncultured Kordia sp.]
MKKNTLLYILVAFLVVMNGFFMFRIFGDKPPKGPNPGNFIVKELHFDEAQLKDFRKINDAHHEEMRKISREVKELKDQLFAQISEASVNEAKVNDLARRIGEKERQKDLKLFYHFKEVQKICTDEQRERLSTILRDALHKHGRRKPR